MSTSPASLRRSLGVFAFVLLSLAPVPGIAGATDLSWTTYTPTNTGIQGNYAFSMLFDAADRLWVAANDPVWDEGGLASFDGTRWRNWSSVDGTCPTFELRVMKQDAQGRIWAASSIGLIRFDGTSFTVYDQSNAPLPSNEVRDVAIDGAGNVWIAMSDVSFNRGGLARFDGSAWTVWTRATGIPWPSPWNGVECVAVDAQNHVWIGSDVVGAARFDGSTWTWFDPSGPNGPPSNWIDDILVDPTGAVWFSTPSSPSKGVARLVGNTWTYSQPVGTGAVHSLTWGPDGRLYAATYSGGVQSFDGTTWRVEGGWPGQHVYSIAFDSQGRLWAAGIGGVARRNPGAPWTIYDVANTGLTGRFVHGIGHDGSGHLWIGTAGGGVCRFDETAWSGFNPYNHGAQPWPFGTDAIETIERDASGRPWIGTYGQGIVVWDGATWTQHLPIPGLVFVRDLARDGLGRMWAAVDGALARYDGVSWTAYTPANSPLPSGELKAVAADAQGNAWVGTFGLYRTDGTSWTDHTPALPADAWVHALATAPNGDVWVGTSQGLLRYDGSSWTTFREEDSTVPANVITALEVTPSGVLWVGAFDGQTYPYHGGLARFDGQTWERWTQENSPLPHEQITSLHSGPDGRVWIGTESGGLAVVTEAAPVGVEPPRAGAGAPGVRLTASPNPLSSGADLSFQLPQAAGTRLEVFDAAGRRMCTLIDEVLPAGGHSRRLEVRGWPAGVYHARLEVAGQRASVRRLAHLPARR